MSIDGTNYYRDLQVDPCANEIVIQAAHRALARIFHPDVQGSDEQMKRINVAWEVLGDPVRRAAYDAARAGAHRAPATSPQPSKPAPMPAAATHAAAFVRSKPADHAGPPPGHPFGSVLDFGRYEGWSLGEIVAIDRQYMEWLARVPAGRGLRVEIDAVLNMRNGPGAADQLRHYRANQQLRSAQGLTPRAASS